jgi:hypothetical protein
MSGAENIGTRRHTEVPLTTERPPAFGTLVKSAFRASS